MDTVFSLLLCLLVVGIGVVIGMAIAEKRHDQADERLTERDAKLQTDVVAFMRTQQLNNAFMKARRAMWDEALQHRQEGGR